MDFDYAKLLLEKTRKDYDILAEDYDRARSFLADDLKDLAEYVQKGEKILDLGCGNGRFYYLLQDKETTYFGVDASEGLIEIAKKKYPGIRFQTEDALNLSFENHSFDKVYSISVLHNIPSRDFQLRYLKEAERVLRPGGLLIIRVWDFLKRDRKNKNWKTFLKYAFLKILRKTKLDFFDAFIPWKNSQGEIITELYFHCFTKKELRSLAEKAGFMVKKIWQAGKGKGANIYLIAEKKSPLPNG